MTSASTAPPSRHAAHLGRAALPITYDVERGHIRRFADAVGDANPIYRDEAAARAAGHARIPAPPTFAAALRANDPRDGMDLDWTKLLHAQQEIEFDRALYAGDRVTLTATLVDVYVKEGRSGVMDFLVVEAVATNDADARVYRTRSTMAVRR